MLKKSTWAENDVVSIRLRDDLYTVAQMRAGHIMQFFAIAKSQPDWAGTDLNQVPTLFFLFVAAKNLKSIFVEQLPADVVTPSGAAVERRMLKPVLGNGEHSAELVELTPDWQVIGARVLQSGLNAARDSALIYQYELTGMAGDADKIARRLTRFFDTGVNWDDAKGFIFKGIEAPPPHWKPA